MNKDIILLNETNDKITIMCEKEIGINSYTVLGMNQYSSYEIIAKTNSNIITLEKNRINRFYNIKIDYIRDNGERELYIGSSNRFVITINNYDSLNIRIIKSYNGYALSITNDTIYDKYILYKKVNNKYLIIYETEDFMFNTKALNTSDVYIIEAYKNEDGIFKLVAKSNEFKCDIFGLKRRLKTPKLSVIIPCYNRAKYISRCIDSVLLSTMNELEVIIVDDCSTDNSSEIINWYKDNYPEYIKYYKNSINEGLAFTRNVGIENAIGRYTAFVDSDDYIHSKMYEYLVDVVTKEKLDICISKTLIRTEIDSYHIYLDLNSNGEKYKIYSYNDMFDNRRYHSKENIFFTSVCNKIVKTSLIKKIKFPIVRVYEDTAYTRTIYSFIDRFGFSYNSYYVWDKRDNKLVDTISSGTTNKNRAFDVHATYNEAVFYALYYGNRNHIEELIYETFEEIYLYLRNFKNKSLDGTVFGYYISEIKKINDKEDVLNNKYVRENKELYDFLRKYLKK